MIRSTPEEMSEHARMLELLRQAMPPVPNDVGPARDLWPAVVSRLNAERQPVPWFDWALAGALGIFVVAFPATIPMLLYYL